MEDKYKISFEEIRALLTEEHYQQEDIESLEKAFEFAKKLHEGQFRISEEPYIIHPIEVVKILIGLRADIHTLMAGFLHDILEDTDTKPEEIKELFGEDVLNLVQGVTKLGKLQFKSKEERQAFVSLIKNFTMTITGLRDFNEAIITKGGVKVKEINPSTMESKLVPGLYFVGEVLDLDALTGGFNLQIAWSTGYAAGNSIY